MIMEAGGGGCLDFGYPQNVESTIEATILFTMTFIASPLRTSAIVWGQPETLGSEINAANVTVVGIS